MTNAWMKLWELAIWLRDETPKIELDPESPDVVVLAYPDGSCGVWYWKDGDWHGGGEASYTRNAHSCVGGEGE